MVLQIERIKIYIKYTDINKIIDKQDSTSLKITSYFYQ